MNLSFLECNDLEWFAVDRVGQLAYFTSGGSIYVPEYWVGALKELQAFSQKYGTISGRGGFRLVPEKRGGIDYRSWTDCAEKGLFGYDFDVQSLRGYRLITIPESPANITDVPGFRDFRMPMFNGVFGIETPEFDRECVKCWMPSHLSG